MLASLFVERPRLALVISLVITIAGALALFSHSGFQFPDNRAAAGVGDGKLSRCFSRSGGADGGAAHRVAGERRRHMIYMKSTSGNDGYHIRSPCRSRSAPIPTSTR